MKSVRHGLGESQKILPMPNGVDDLNAGHMQQMDSMRRSSVDIAKPSGPKDEYSAPTQEEMAL